jgi:two-component system LytT family response regulator
MTKQNHQNIHILIADDEPLARKKIRTTLIDHGHTGEIDEASNGLEAVQRIVQSCPDLIFLDIQMPVLDGFGVVQTVGVEKMPTIIFVTAYDEYAIKAFEAQALDYLLKPFKPNRLIEACQRAAERIENDGNQQFNQRLLQLIEGVHKKQSYLDRVVIKTSQEILFVKVSDIDWIEAAGNYVELHCDEKTYLMRETMNTLEHRLNPSHFLRIHRSTIVNLDKVKSIQADIDRDCIVLMQDNTKLTMSRRYKEKMNKAVNIANKR